MPDDDKPTGHPSSHKPSSSPNKPIGPAEMGPFSATYPAAATLPYDEVMFGPDAGGETVHRLLGTVSGKRVLDLGCGSGHSSIALALAGAHVVAIDPSEENLQRLRRAAEEHEIRVESHSSDLADLAFLRADSIDLVFSAYSLAQVADLERAFRQIHRVLRTDRHFVFSLPHPAFSMVDPASSDPLRVRRSYWDRTPREWEIDQRRGADHPRTVSDVFTWLSRSSFRVDTLLEPQPATAGPLSEYHSEIMNWVPATLIMRARKQGL